MIKASIFIFCAILIPSIACAHPSADVPVRHWSYEAVERLAMAGLCDISTIGVRPISRISMAYVIKSAIEKSRDYSLEFPWQEQEYYEALLYKLIDEFRDELVEIGVEVASVSESAPPSFRYSSPELKMEEVYAKLDSRGMRFENKQGWKIKDGLNIRARLATWVKAWNFFALSVTPGIRFASDNSDLDADIEEATLRFSHPSYNMELSLGRSSMWWGPGFHGALLMTDNAFPLDVIRWNNVHPFRLPWLFRRLGRFNALFIVSRLEAKRAVSNPFVTGWRLDYTPCGFLKFGFGHILMHGGKGVKKLGFSDYWASASLVFSAAGGGTETENHIISGDAQLFIKRIDRFLPVATGAKLYTEWGAEDEAGNIPVHLGSITGAYVTDIFRIPGLDGRIEVTRLDKIWYSHFRYRSGYTHRGDYIGHSLGPDASEIAAQAIFNYPDRYRLIATAAHQRRGLTKALIETTNEARIEFSLKDALDMYNIDNVNMSFFYEFEDIENHDNTGSTARNHLFGIEIERKF